MAVSQSHGAMGKPESSVGGLQQEFSGAGLAVCSALQTHSGLAKIPTNITANANCIQVLKGGATYSKPF